MSLRLRFCALVFKTYSPQRHRGTEAKDSCLQDSHIELRHVGIQASGFESCNQNIASLQRIDDGIDPQARCAVARVGLFVVGSFYGFKELLLLFVAQLLASALELLDFDVHQRARGLSTAHHGIARRRPSENESWIVSFAAHCIVPCAE